MPASTKTAAALGVRRVVIEVFQGRVVILIRNDPLSPVLRHAGDRQIASRFPHEVVEIVTIVRVENLPRVLRSAFNTFKKTARV
jgi:hypothetical protein